MPCGFCNCMAERGVFCTPHTPHSVTHAACSGDFRRQRFGQILDLVPLADEITKLQARCSCCNDDTPAHFTLRVTADDSQVAVGGSDKYIPVCRAHYVELHQVRSQPSSPTSSPGRA